MTGKYRIEIELLLDESTATQALALARNIYLQRGGARTVESGIEREMSADEFVDDSLSRWTKPSLILTRTRS